MSKRYRSDLREIALFAECTDDQLTAIGAAAEDYRIGPGTVLAHEGRRESQFYLIVSGEAEVSRGGKRIATLGPGDHFGEIAVLADTARNATITATTELRALEFQSWRLMAILDDVPALREKLLHGLASRLHRMDGAA